MAIRGLVGAAVLAILCAGASADEKYSVPEPTIEVFSPKGFRATIPNAQDLVYFLIQGQLTKAGSDKKEDFHGGETGSPVEIKKGEETKKYWIVDLPDIELKKGDRIEYLAFVAIKNDGYIRDSLSYTVNEFSQVTPLPARPVYPTYEENIPSSSSTLCEPTVTRVHGRKVCKDQVIFEENFDSLDEEVWQIEHYIPIDHPENPFVSYQRKAVEVKNGELHISPTQQTGIGASLFGALDLSERCTSGELEECKIDQVENSGREVPPVTSGRVTSKPSFAFKYGTVSIRAKFPKGDWIYPELLLEPFLKKFGVHSRNTGVVKIATGNAEINKVLQNLRAGPFLDSRCPDVLFVSRELVNADWSDNFHDYSVKWTPEFLEFSIDGVVYGTVGASWNGLRSTLPTKCSGVQAAGIAIAPFNEYFYLTLGVAVGGDTEFADTNTTNPEKPWINGKVHAASRFWNSTSWKTNWQNPKLVVDYVKVKAL